MSYIFNPKENMMAKNLLAYVNAFLNTEKNSLSLWYPASYLFGILYYFTFLREPNLFLLFLGIIICSAAKFKLFKPNQSALYKFTLNIMLVFTLGLTIPTVKTHFIEFIAIKKKLQSKQIEGEISKIKPTPYGTQVYLTNLAIEGINPEDTPQIIRIIFAKNSTSHLLAGDRISFLGDLSPLPPPLVPGGYDFQKIAFFNKIGALGKSISEPKIIGISGNKFMHIIHNIRKVIYSKLIKNLGYKNGNFAAALFLGEIGGIDQKTLKNMRFAGISHILCVSGLHLSLMAAIFFITSRFLLNFSNLIAYRYDIKKIAGYISLIASFFYLLLTGMQVAATRAFIMTGFAIWSILISRQPYPLRSLGIAAIIILTMNPEVAITPSFQLSFIAVASLLCGYEFYIRNTYIFGKSKGIFASMRLYIISNIFSSIVAGIATAPIVIYHFYIYSNYSVISNLLALPIVSFISMPFGIMAIILSFFNSGSLAFLVLGKSIEIVVQIGNFVASLPKAVIYTGYMNHISALLFTLGFLWFVIWKSRIRLLGMFVVILAILGFLFQKKPGIIVNLNARIFG